MLERAMRVISGDYINRVAAGIILAALMVWPAISAENAAPIPDLSGQWGRNTVNFETPVSGPGPVINTVRKADDTFDNNIPVGDYPNPILKPEAAGILRERGEISLSGRAFPSPHNQCWPEPPLLPGHAAALPSPGSRRVRRHLVHGQRLRPGCA